MGVNMLVLATNFAPLQITYLLAMPVAGLWVGVDSETRIGNGWLWGSIAFVCPFIGVPLYYGLLLYYALNTGQRNKQLDAERDSIREQTRRFNAMGAIEREHYMMVAEQAGGTLYGDSPTAATPNTRHFTDQRAEELLALRRYDEAREYLSDLLALAKESGDRDREQTYRFYLEQIPE